MLSWVSWVDARRAGGRARSGRRGWQAEELAAAWARRFAALAASIREGAPWRSADDLNAEALAEALCGGPPLPEAAVRQLAPAGHRLRPWPDNRDALCRLAGRFTVVALPDGNRSMLTDVFAAARLTWHCVLSGEMVRAGKPDPAVYRARARPGENRRRTLMVAATPLGPTRRRGPRASHRRHPARRRRRAAAIGHLRPDSPRPGCPHRTAADHDVTTGRKNPTHTKCGVTVRCSRIP